MSSHLFFFSAQQEARPDVSRVITLSEAIGQRQRIAIDYRSSHDQLTHRKVEPYGIIGWDGHWYLVGYCCPSHPIMPYGSTLRWHYWVGRALVPGRVPVPVPPKIGRAHV